MSIMDVFDILLFIIAGGNGKEDGFVVNKTFIVLINGFPVSIHVQHCSSYFDTIQCFSKVFMPC